MKVHQSSYIKDTNHAGSTTVGGICSICSMTWSSGSSWNSGSGAEVIQMMAAGMKSVADKLYPAMGNNDSCHTLVILLSLSSRIKSDQFGLDVHWQNHGVCSDPLTVDHMN